MVANHRGKIEEDLYMKTFCRMNFRVSVLIVPRDKINLCSPPGLSARHWYYNPERGISQSGIRQSTSALLNRVIDLDSALLDLIQKQICGNVTLLQYATTFADRSGGKHLYHN